jgi:hypothetical protein
MKPLSVINYTWIRHSGKWLLLFLLVLAGRTVVAQKLSIKFSPFSLLDPGTPTVMMGAEMRVSRTWAVELDYGLKTNTGVLHWNVDKSRYHYFKLRSEVKYYLPFWRNNKYVAIAGFYVPQSYDDTNNTYYDPNIKYRYDKAHVDKNVYGLCLKIGWVKKLSQRFSFEVFAGVGVRFVDMEFTNVEGKTEAIDGLNEWFSKNDMAGRQTLLHLETGLKINYLVIR